MRTFQQKRLLMPNMVHPNPNMLLYCGIADALTFPAEYDRGSMAQQILDDPSHYYRHPKGDAGYGRYSDDTEMSAANANVLIKFDARYWTKLSFAQEYLNEFNRGKRRKGYARSFYSFLCKTRNGTEFLQNIRPDSTKNGAVMRASVFGALPDIDSVKRFSAIQASITHDTPEGIFSAQAIALASHFALWTDRPMTEIGAFVADHLSESRKPFDYVFREHWNRPINGSYATVAIETTHAILHLLSHERSMKDIIAQTLLWGGDVDSVASVAWSIASARLDTTDISPTLIQTLDRGDAMTGAEYLQDLGARLMQKFNQPS